MEHCFRFFVNRKTTSKGGGEHLRVIDIPVDRELVVQANLANEKLIVPPGEIGVQYAPADDALQAARAEAESQLDKHEEIGAVSSILLEDQ